eukprot:scaffold23471_cov141-Cylindrotheca_fusiformis.AAC.3
MLGNGYNGGMPLILGPGAVQPVPGFVPDPLVEIDLPIHTLSFARSETNPALRALESLESFYLARGRDAAKLSQTD